MKNILFFLVLVFSFSGTNTYLIEPANIETDNIVNYGVTKLNQGILFLGLYKKKTNYNPTFSYYFTEIIGQNKFEKVKRIKIKGQRQRDLGCPVFVESANELIFPMAANATGGRYTDYEFKLYTGYLVGNEIKDIELLNFCQPNSSYISPTISSDGLKLIFIHNGKLSTVNRKSIYDDWSQPSIIEELAPLEPKVPRLINDSLLTFSTHSTDVIGNDDIYTALKYNGKWMPTRPWEELNSAWADFGVTMIDSVSGYFSSGRNGASIQIYYFNTKE